MHEKSTPWPWRAGYGMLANRFQKAAIPPEVKQVSALLTRLLALSVAPRIIPSKLSHVSQPPDGPLVLSLYGPDGETRHLGFSLRLMNPLIFLADSRPASRPKPTNFISSLRKHLEAARLSDVEQTPGERVITFRFASAAGDHRLVYEGLSKYPNLILVGPDGAILSAIRYLNDVERPVLPESPYAPAPQPKDKSNIWDLDGATLETLASPVAEKDRIPWLKNAFRGSDIETATYLATSALGLAKAWDDVKQRIANGRWGPLQVEKGPPPRLRLYPTPQPDARLVHDPLMAAALHQAALDSHENFLTVKRRLEQEIRTALKREKRVLEKLKGDRAEAEKSDQYQWWGELVMAYLHTLPAHSSEAVLEDLVRGTGATVRIKLDPSLSPLDNARKFFRKAQKGSRGLSLVEEREREIQARLEKLKWAERTLPALTTSEEAQAAFKELFKAKKIEKAPPPKKEPKVPTPNVVREKINKDWELVCGTSATANEYITFQLAQAEDLWFHVRDFPGSHVLLRRLRREAVAAPELVLRAALEAATRSKAPTPSKVTVSYTEKKNVKRIPGMGTGTVSFTKEKSVVVETSDKA